MGTGISNASGNHTGAATYAAVEAGALATVLNRNTTTSIATATTVTSVTFTVTNADVIDGALLWLMTSGTVGTGTFKVDLQKGGVSQASVTVNKSDLPDSTNNLTVPVFFKFTSTATGDGGSNWTLVLTTTSGTGSATVTISIASATTTNYTRALRTTAAMTLAAGDDFYVISELTGAGTKNLITVTMNSVAATAYGSGSVNSTTVNGGGCHVGFWGTLSYGFAAATDYILRLAGDMWVHANGALDVCQASTVTMTIASPGVVTLTAHGFENGRIIRLRTTGALPTGLSSNVNYYVVNATTDTFELAATSGGTSINTTGSQSGAHTLSTGMPRTSTAVLEFQNVSAGDFGHICRDNGVSNIMGLSRTSGKDVSKVKLTSNVTNSLIAVSGTTVNATATGSAGTDYAGQSFGASLTDSVTNATHSASFSGTTVSNTTQTCRVWLKRGTGTNNRYVRLTMGNASTQSSVTNGFFSDIDLQAGTAGTVTAVGNGTATSVSIVALRDGYLITMTGKVSSGSATTWILVNICSAAATLSFAGANNIALYYSGPWLVSASSMADITLNVDTDSGWKSGDAILIPSTDRTSTNFLSTILSADAGASSMTTLIGIAGVTQYGTSPLQGSVVLLTRNVKVRSTTYNLFTYTYCLPKAVVNYQWAELSFYGPAVGGKAFVFNFEGSSGTAGAKTVANCSIANVNNTGNTVNAIIFGTTYASNSVNLNFSNNLIFSFSSNNGNYAINMTSAYTLGDWTLDNNLLCYAPFSCSGFLLSQLNGTVTNNIVTGYGANTGFVLNASGTFAGTFSGNTSYGGNAAGFNIGFNRGVLSNCAAWHNNGAGITLSNDSGDTIFNGLMLVGNNGSGLSMNGGNGINVTGSYGSLGTNPICSSTSFTQSYGIRVISGTVPLPIDVSGVDFAGSAGAPLAVNGTADFDCQFGTINVIGTMNYCKFGAPTAISGVTNWSNCSYLAMQRYSQTAADHRVQMFMGILKSDSVIFNTAAPSMRMTPSSATLKLPSAQKGKGFLKDVDSGGTVSISVYVRKSAAGDGAAYNGNQPRLIQRANGALGQPVDVVLATYSAGTGAWNQLSATSSTASGDNGAFEFYVDCDGTTGWINVDDWA